MMRRRTLGVALSNSAGAPSRPTNPRPTTARSPAIARAPIATRLVEDQGCSVITGIGERAACAQRERLARVAVAAVAATP